MTTGDSRYLDDRLRVASYLRKHAIPRDAERALSSEFMYCHTCLKLRKHAAKIIYSGEVLDYVEESPHGTLPPIPDRSPYLLHYRCSDCKSQHFALLVVADGPPPDRTDDPIERARLAVIPITALPSSSHTDRSVRYFFNEGETARLAGAYAAALAMYRAAAEALVRSLGISESNLSASLKRLEQRVQSGEDIQALNGLPVDVLHALREIGNAAVHFVEMEVYGRTVLRGDTALAAARIVALLVNPERPADWTEADAVRDLKEAIAVLRRQSARQLRGDRSRTR